MHQDHYLKTEKRKRERILIPIIEIVDTKSKRINGSVPLFQTKSESESGTLPAHSMYIQNVLTRKVSHNPTFGVYQDDTEGSFKIERASFKYNYKHVFVDGKSTRQRKAIGNY